jgi:F0F1-type ATP synthase gamma subunit
VLSIILIYRAWSYNNGGPARLRQFNRLLPASYTSIADPSDQALEAEVTAYTKNEHSSLPAARKALQKEVATELAFNNQLAELPFPPDTAVISDRLIQANQKRSQLIQQQAQAPTLARMRAMDGAHRAADNVVEVQVRALRSALGLPPPAAN